MHIGFQLRVRPITLVSLNKPRIRVAKSSSLCHQAPRRIGGA
jgi:hypothetical protein